MPHDTNGFTVQEIVNHVSGFTGNWDSDFQTWLKDKIAMAQFRYCKLHDWSFLHRNGLDLSVESTDGSSSEYDLNFTINAVTYKMLATNVETIYSPEDDLVLERTDLSEMRRSDPNDDDGTLEAGPTAWAPMSDNRIKLWAPKFPARTLKVDGKINPSALHGVSAYPLIPYEYQEGFMDLILAVGLYHENDSRADKIKAGAFELIRQDVEADMQELSATTLPRIRHWREAAFDGVSNEIEALLFALVDND